MAAALCLKAVTKTYVSPAETVVACDGVNLLVHPGQLVWLRGASGSGKSTLILIAAGILSIDGGSVDVGTLRLVNDSDADRARARRSSIGVVFQDYLLVDEFTVLENVMLPLEALGWDSTTVQDHAADRLRLVGLADMAHRLPSELSGGQRQRVAIARALAGDRRVILADEPTGALDSTTSAEVFALLRRLADEGVAVVVASHDPMCATFADATYEMEDGKLAPAASISKGTR